ncbi:DUF262 domain-containing protein [Echinicola sp. 20G]|uniref:DUF262 domain-containing protein n=1 Tax=Echinicola sp. 20G TaxID=2781961 RepID=UPI001910695E|nr:DUF262 domain-containing protein [Echinicola sp. 20G]
MTRQPTTQQITWFLDLDRNGQLDLSPPYQRKSVWSAKDKRFFLDTIFRNYPAPPVFIHRTIDDNGFTEYHVVDGKQRLETIIAFANSKIAIGTDYGDVNLNGKKFKDLSVEYKRRFWDYTLVVDFIDSIEGNNIEEVFDRVNRNARNLQPQELRHARYNGWFVNEVENEAQNDFWWRFKISTRGRDKRMRNVQFISELFMIMIEGKISGFDQSNIDETYATYDDIDELIENNGFEPEAVLDRVRMLKDIIEQMEQINGCISEFAGGSNNNFYTLWAALATAESPDVNQLATNYRRFMETVSNISEENQEEDRFNENHILYYENSRGASTDFTQRNNRLTALTNVLT